MTEQSTILVYLAAAVSTCFVFLYLRAQLSKRSACYALQKVRDDLVLLVAKGIIAEENKVFQTYYKRIDYTLKAYPKVGFDDLLDAVIRHKNTSDFGKNMAKAQATAEKMSKAVENEPEEVRTIIYDYYLANQHMLLAHSRPVRFLYLFIMKGWLPHKVSRIFGSTVDHGLTYVKFAGESATLFR